MAAASQDKGGVELYEAAEVSCGDSAEVVCSLCTGNGRTGEMRSSAHVAAKACDTQVPCCAVHY